MGNLDFRIKQILLMQEEGNKALKEAKKSAEELKQEIKESITTTGNPMHDFIYVHYGLSPNSSVVPAYTSLYERSKKGIGNEFLVRSTIHGESTTNGFELGILTSEMKFNIASGLLQFPTKRVISYSILVSELDGKLHEGPINMHCRNFNPSIEMQQTDNPQDDPIFLMDMANLPQIISNIYFGKKEIKQELQNIGAYEHYVKLVESVMARENLSSLDG